MAIIKTKYVIKTQTLTKRKRLHRHQGAMTKKTFRTYYENGYVSQTSESHQFKKQQNLGHQFLHFITKFIGDLQLNLNIIFIFEFNKFVILDNYFQNCKIDFL